MMGKSKETFDDLLNSYVSNYKMLEENDDGTTTIEITAPDFEEIIKILSKTDNIENVDSELLLKTIKDHPDCQKNYKIFVEKNNIQEIEKKFLQQVSYELIVSAMERIDLNKGEGAEE